MEAKSLTPVQKKASLSGKQNKVRLKSSLLSPYVSSWAMVSEEATNLILESIKSVFSGLNLKNRSQNTLESGDSGRKRLTKQERKDLHLQKTQSMRDQLVLGTASITRAVERGQVSLVIVERSSPWKLHRHLYELCGVRGCVAGAIEGLEKTVGPHLGISRLSAIGFKNQSDKGSQLFLPLLETASKHLPPLKLPWLQSKAVAEDTASDVSNDCTRTETPDSDGKKDYSHLYILKADVPKRKLSLCDKSEYLTLNTAESAVCSKIRKVETEEAACQKSYVSADVGRIRPNPERQRKKKKKKAKS